VIEKRQKAVGRSEKAVFVFWDVAYNFCKWVITMKNMKGMKKNERKELEELKELKEEKQRLKEK
jgi:hypothetical protein